MFAINIRNHLQKKTALSLSLDPHHSDEGDDDNNNNPPQPGSPAQEAPGGSLPETGPHSAASSLSTDSIDFFSAREKFLGLSQDGSPARPEPASSPRAAQSRCPSQELPPLPDQDQDQDQDEHEQDQNPEDSQGKCSPPPEDPCGAVDEPQPDNGVSVRHMVTELESISTMQLPLPQQAPRSPPQPLTPEGAPEPPSTPSPPQAPSPTAPVRSWATGSVRRVRRQLEQRLRQELEGPPAACAPEPPAPSPPATPRSPQPSLHPDRPEHPRAPSPRPAAAAPDEACTEPEEARGCEAAASAEERDRRLPDSDSSALPEPPSPPSSVHAYPEGAALPPLPTPPALELDGQPGLLWLEGVTEMETDTDGDGPSPAQPPQTPHGRLARSSEDLEKIQETLRELQAFLYEAGGARGGPEGEEPGRTSEQEWELEQTRGEGEGEAQPRTEASRSAEPRGPAVWQRAMEIEARIRQAGLTPPSLMKRSASLAKLDCLELSTNDLSGWDFHAAPGASAGGLDPSSDSQQQQRPRPPSLSLCPSLAHPVPDDAYKKQRVLHQSPSSPRPGLCPKEEGRTAGPAPPPPPSPPPCPQLRQKGRLSAPDHSHPQPSQHGKPHPLRRLRKAADKKRTVTVLYNTM